MYKVLMPFVDGENGKPLAEKDGGHTYAEGDEYPKSGFEPTRSISPI